MDVGEFEIKTLNLLAFPKSESPICELTGRLATVQLVTQYCSLYYSTRELAEQAWFGIVKKIAHLLGPLMAPAPIVGTSEERTRREHNVLLSKRSLMEFCLSESLKLISVLKFQLAIPAAIQALKFAKDVDGDRSITVVEPYLQLAQIYLGLKQLNKAEEYLSLAQWIVLNTPECEDKTRSRLHMLTGRVYTAQGNFEEAKTEFSKSVYFSSRCFGAEAVATSMGYYRLGDVFLAQAKVESALAFFDKVVDIWYKYLSNLHRSVDSQFQANNSVVGGSTSMASVATVLEELTDENLSDGRDALEQILEHRRRLLSNHHIATGEALYTVGLFEFFLLGKETTAEKIITAALKIYETQLSPQHPSTKHVAGVLELIEQQCRARKSELGEES